jgi:hypothetical protein
VNFPGLNLPSLSSKFVCDCCSRAQLPNHSNKSIQITRVKVRRKTVGLTIRENLLSEARENEINLSKLLENTLIQTLEPQTNGFSLIKVLFSPKEKVWWAGPDLNRRPSARQADILPN